MDSKEHEMTVIERLFKQDKLLMVEYLCPRCSVDLEKVMQSHYKCKYCPECGQKVRWY